jgi:protein arginine kinase activator
MEIVSLILKRVAPTMKCQQCEKPATFHITELTGNEPQEFHLCEDHAKQYLSAPETMETPSPTIAGVLAKQLKLGQTAEELARLDQRACPMCGITFYEFRHQGRLGCPHDYDFFEKELEPLLVNIHGEKKHVGKRPKSGRQISDGPTKLIRLRRDLQDAVDREDYELASRLRDEIRGLEE